MVCLKENVLWSKQYFIFKKNRLRYTCGLLGFIDINTYSYRRQEFKNILERKLCNRFGQNTLSRYPGWIHPGKFPGENLFRKITPRRKTFGFFTSLKILHNLFHPEENTASLIVSREFLDFTQWVLILPLWCHWYSLMCGNILPESRQCEVTLPPKFEVKFLDYDKLIIVYLFLLVFYRKLGIGC